MSKKTNRQPKLGWIVGGIWLAVIFLGGALFIFLGGAGFSSSPEAAAAVDGLFPAAPQPVEPTSTVEYIVTFPPKESPTAAMIPTSTPGPSPTPIVFPTIRATSDAPWEGPIVIGYSVEERPIEVWRFGQGPRKYLVVHGGYEINTIELTDQLIRYFSSKPESVPSDATLFILRSLNPDGESLPHKKEGRANANDVDLNRSFPVGWSAT